jgi:hypothetical protein
MTRTTRIAACLLLASLVMPVCGADSRPVKVTVQQLLDSPARFAGQRVDVTGYYRTGTEDSCLIRRKDCANGPDPTKGSIWLDPVIWDPRYYPRRLPKVDKSDVVENRVVRVIGTFRYQPRPILGEDVPYERRFKGFGCYNMWAREITDITFIQPTR